MSKTLIVAEKPSVGRDLAAALGGSFSRSSQGNYLESETHVVSWAIGHLLSLAEPEAYHPRYKRWCLEDLPILPEKFKLVSAPKTRAQLASLKALMGREDISLVVNACDAGREGELIFRLIAQHLRLRKPVQRLWLQSLTREAIQEGLRSMRESEELDGLADAARCRSEADWMVGMNGSRAASLTLRHALGGGASLGRVQTPTLAILVRRELEIGAFQPEDYWVVEAAFSTQLEPIREYSGLWQDGRRLGTAQEAEQIVERTRERPGVISALEVSRQEERAPLLYDLTTLQREASKAFGWTAAQTLKLAQALYEQHKLLTYPRTDTRWLTTDQASGLPKLLEQVARVPAYQPHVERLLKERELRLEQVINDKKVSDHTAIVPTGLLPQPARLSRDEIQLYGMVARRLLAALHPVAVFEKTRVTTLVAEQPFISKGRVLKEPGWRACYQGVGWARTEESQLPRLVEQEAVRVREMSSKAKQTQPPKRLTDAGLLGAMETAGKNLEDEQAREAMKESGLGTPATRASIIERLLKAGYARREKKNLVPTEKGIRLINLLGEHPLASPALTGEWERRLAEVERGALERRLFMEELENFVRGTVSELTRLGAAAESLPPEQWEKPRGKAKLGEPLAPCPSCGKPVRESPKSWSCWSREEPGCGLAIWKTMAGLELREETALQLLQQGVSAQPLEGFKSKAGKPFQARLKLAPDEEGIWKVSFLFQERVSAQPGEGSGSRAPLPRGVGEEPPPYDPGL